MNISDLKYLGTMIRIQSHIHEEINNTYICGMIATTHFRIFCFPIFDLNKNLQYTDL
jgi:hypothetical protein